MLSVWLTLVFFMSVYPLNSIFSLSYGDIILQLIFHSSPSTWCLRFDPRWFNFSLSIISVAYPVLLFIWFSLVYSFQSIHRFQFCSLLLEKCIAAIFPFIAYIVLLTVWSTYIFCFTQSINFSLYSKLFE